MWVLLLALGIVMILSVLAMMMMTLRAPYRLWLDDERPAPPSWYWAKTAEEALGYLQTYQVTEMSMDHDLGVCPKCRVSGESCHHDGYYVLKEMADQDLWPSVKPTVHSMNPVGRERMLSFIDRYFPIRE